MAMPASTGNISDELREEVAPITEDDEKHGWHSAIFCNAIGLMIQDLRDWVSDSDDGPGWSMIFDVNRVPYKAVGYLSNFAGVVLPPQGINESNDAYLERARNILRDQPNQARGTPAAMVAAARNSGGIVGPDGTGQTATVILRERDTSAYHLTVITYTSQTTDSNKVLQALLSQKPAGLVLNYSVQSIRTWADVKAEFANWGAVKAGNANWQIVRDTPPAH